MFQVIDGLPDTVVALRAVGKVTGEDYRAVLEPAVARATADDAKARLLMVLGADFEGYDLGAVAADAGVGTATTSRPYFCAVVAQRSAKKPVVGTSTLSPGEKRFAMLASHAPLPEAA